MENVSYTTSSYVNYLSYSLFQPSRLGPDTWHTLHHRLPYKPDTRFIIVFLISHPNNSTHFDSLIHQEVLTLGCSLRLQQRGLAQRQPSGLAQQQQLSGPWRQERICPSSIQHICENTVQTEWGRGTSGESK